MAGHRSVFAVITPLVVAVLALCTRCIAQDAKRSDADARGAAHAAPTSLPPIDPILALPRCPTPTPNGYAVLEKLAERVNRTHEVNGDFSGGTYHPPSREAELAPVPAQLEDNRVPLEELRRALGMQWLYPHPPAPGMLFPELSKARYLARLLVGQAVLQDQQGQTVAAVRNLLDVLGLGVKLRRGGYAMQWLVGQSVENMAFKKLRWLVGGHRLPSQVLLSLPGQLRELERQTVPLREIIACEYEAQGPQSLNLTAAEFWKLLGGSPDFGPTLRLPGADNAARDFVLQRLPQLMARDAEIARLSAEPYFAIREKVAGSHEDSASSDYAAVMQPFPTKALQHQAEEQCYWQALRIMVGLELDRATRGRYAAQLSQVKGLSAEDLQDPFSGKPLPYRLQGDGYVLYSTGPDGKDHGGHRQHGSVTEGSDLVLWPDDPPQS